MSYKQFSQLGVTLIELMIVIVIVGVLSAIAIPFYQNYIFESNRTEAKAELMKAQLLLEEYRISCPKYGVNINDCATPLATTSLFSNSNHYDFSLSAPASTSYTLTAKAKGNQLNDKIDGTPCSQLTVNQSNQREPSVCW